jgi:cardiolipin synthase
MLTVCLVRGAAVQHSHATASRVGERPPRLSGMFEAIDRMKRAAGEGGAASQRILTVPNLISFTRLLLIPVFVWLLCNPGTEAWGIILLGVVVASDWVDGWVARKTNSVSEFGRLLDPFSDRLVIAAALLTFAFQDAFPWWAVAAVVCRDVLVLGAGIVAVSLKHQAIAVRWLGKVGTFDLMTGIPMIAWGGFGLPLAAAALACGWPIFLVGLALYYVSAGQYLMDLIHLFQGRYVT